MKIRSGFVSNSSSTSFLIWIEEDIHSKDEFIEEMDKYLFFNIIDHGMVDGLRGEYLRR